LHKQAPPLVPVFSVFPSLFVQVVVALEQVPTELASTFAVQIWPLAHAVVLPSQ
jgi:hypothetical protein